VEQNEERRRWNRLQLPVPVFISSEDSRGKPFTELTVAVNISGGGALVAVHEVVSSESKVRIEVPCPPIPELPLLEPRTLEALIVRSELTKSCQLLGLQFVQPISPPQEPHVVASISK
jgi:c-di-GMP-binding flagellar brake protein YcgR